MTLEQRIRDLATRMGQSIKVLTAKVATLEGPRLTKTSGNNIALSESFDTDPFADNKLSKLNIGGDFAASWDASGGQIILDTGSGANHGLMVIKTLSTANALVEASATLEYAFDYSGEHHFGMAIGAGSDPANFYRFAIYQGNFDLYLAINGGYYALLQQAPTGFTPQIGEIYVFKITYNKVSGLLTGYLNGNLVISANNTYFQNLSRFYAIAFCYHSRVNFKELSINGAAAQFVGILPNTKVRSGGLVVGPSGGTLGANQYAYIENLDGVVLKTLWLEQGDQWTFLP